EAWRDVDPDLAVAGGWGPDDRSLESVYSFAGWRRAGGRAARCRAGRQSAADDDLAGWRAHRGQLRHGSADEPAGGQLHTRNWHVRRRAAVHLQRLSAR